VRILSVVGTRPQLIKAAALIPALRRRHQEVFVDTGQHWDDEMAGAFFRELHLPRPDVSLGLGGGNGARQVGEMLVALESVLRRHDPEVVLVYGDTNSTLAGALAAATLGYPVAHVEAGLRSFDRTMPEEINRIVADRLARWLFAPTPQAVANLAAEGIREGVWLVGDLLQDLAARTLPEIRDPAILGRLSLEPTASSGGDGLVLRPGGYLLATVHRAANRDPERIGAWLDLLAAVASPHRPVVLPIHPGTKVALEAHGFRLPPGVRAVAPVGYRTSLALQLHAAAVLTDSGGVQREAAWLGVPCLILREETEWLEAVGGSGGRVVLVGLRVGEALAALDRLAPPDEAPAAALRRAATVHLSPAGAADRIAAILAGEEPRDGGW
jgi:UDP-N-acetylglucosamine 2-epimerase